MHARRGSTCWLEKRIKRKWTNVLANTIAMACGAGAWRHCIAWRPEERSWRAMRCDGGSGTVLLPDPVRTRLSERPGRRHWKIERYGHNDKRTYSGIGIGWWPVAVCTVRPASLYPDGACTGWPHKSLLTWASSSSCLSVQTLISWDKQHLGKLPAPTCSGRGPGRTGRTRERVEYFRSISPANLPSPSRHHDADRSSGIHRQLQRARSVVVWVATGLAKL